MQTECTKTIKQKIPALLVGVCTLLLTPITHADEPSARQQALTELTEEIRRDHPRIPHLDIEEVRAQGDNIVFIDVREPREYAVSHIPGAIHINDRDSLLSFAQEHSDTTLVLYCSVGRRSAELTDYLHEQGALQAVNFVGSIFAWGNQNLPLKNEDGPTKFVHPYNWFWGWQYLDAELHANKPVK